MNVRRAIIRSLLTGAALASSVAIAGATRDELGFVRIRPAEVEWQEQPGFGGLKMAILAGDPSKPGLYVIRVKFPPGVMTRPHRHPEDRHAVVISGTWYTGEGRAFEPDRTVPLSPGSYMMHPSGGYHYDGAKTEEVVVQIAGVGPSDTILADPALGSTGRSSPAR